MAAQGTEDGQELLSSWKDFMILCPQILSVQLLLLPAGPCFQGQGSAEPVRYPAYSVPTAELFGATPSSQAPGPLLSPQLSVLTCHK